MSRDDLLELAGLDAMGLLNSDQCTAFEEAMAQAPPRLQDEIRCHQEAVVGLGDQLPDVVPDPSLRHRVIAAISKLIANDAERSVTPSLTVPHLPGWPVPAGTDRAWIERLAAGRVSPVWRVAALFLATACLALGWSAWDNSSTWRGMRQAFINNRVDELLTSDMGRPVSDFIFDRQVQFIVLVPVPDTPFPAQVTLALIPDKAVGMLFVRGLPDTGQKYELSLQPAGGTITISLASFTANGAPIMGVDFDLKTLNPTGAVWTLSRQNDHQKFDQVMTSDIS